MIVSPIITPFRWYNRFYEQNRYDVECSNTCEFKLITDRGHLLPFQFTRDASGHLIDKWLLRSACVDAEPKVLTPQQSKFYGDFENDWTLDGRFSVVCGILKSGPEHGDTATLNNSLTIGKRYRLTFCVADLSLVPGSNLYIKFNDSLTHFNQLGYYEFEFIPATTYLRFDVHADGTVDPSDFIGIEGLQVSEVFTQSGDDIVLDKSLIELANVGVTDYFVYCGSSLGQSLPCGDYYSIIITTDGLIYYSELITVKDFIPETCKYYILTWGNTCDIENVLYQNVGCTYRNRLYLDQAIITKPEYPFKEEGEMDGNQRLKPTFQKWEKDIQFLIGKCPEFIVDALTGIRLHDTITVNKPLRNEQLQPTDVILIESVECDVANILNDCFQNVNLKLLLPDKYIDSACCGNNTVTACLECEYTVTTPINDFGDDGPDHYAFAFGGEAPNGLYLWNGDSEMWDFVVVGDGTIVCVQDDVYVFLSSVDDWFPIVTISSVVHTPGPPSTFRVIGYAFPDSYIQIETSLDGTNWTVDSQIVTAVEFQDPGVVVPLLAEPEIRFRAHNYTLNCDYGYSNINIWFDE